MSELWTGGVAKLWIPNERYEAHEPQSLWNMPYRRLYKNLPPEKLEELLRDAKRQRWEVLDLNRCGLSDIPDTLGELEDLRFVHIGNTFLSINGRPNTFTALPDSIGNLKNLKSLDLYDAQIRALPDSIGNLTSLQSLNLHGVQIRALPDSIGNLKNLKSLDLHDAQIRALPDSIGNLSNLQELNLSDTQIRALPDSIGNLSNLRNLNLRNCHLQEIPCGAVALGLPFVIDKKHPHKNCANLTGVTLDKGDLPLFAQPREVIEAYYRGEAISIWECKAIFLGDGAAGKSSLIERMVNGTFEPGSLPTDGVKTTKWETTLEGKPFALRILDFGGQEIMHSMHRCFLTAHTVYVVVCESRDDAKIDGAAARWLETVKTFAPDCPVILALNKADLNGNVSVNERDLRERNPALKRVLKTSAHDEPDSEYGVNHLIEAIRKEIPGAVNDYKMNVDMQGVKQALEDMRDDYISSERYREICGEHHITNEKLQYDLLGFFRDLGVAYYYETPSIDTRLESVRVLNPEWLTNGIYRLILRTREDGFLNHTEIKETLRATHAGDVHRDITYTPEETEYILHVMRYFEISHYIGDGVEMIPMKMPKTPPDRVDEFPKKDALHLRWESSYLPNNLIHRLLIRKFPELDTKCVWRTGGRFHQTGGGCEALAEMNEKVLDVYVNGKRDCRQYLETFRGVIRNILDGLNLKAEEMICQTVNGRDGKVSYQAALSHLHNNKPEIYLANIDEFVSPVILLKEVYVDVDRELARYRQELAHTVRDAPPLPDKPTEKAENPLEDEKTRAEIEQLKAEAKKNNVAVTLTVARALLIPALIVLAWVAGRSDLIEKFLEFLFSPFNG